MNFHVWNFILKFHLECWPFPSDLLMIFSMETLKKKSVHCAEVRRQGWCFFSSSPSLPAGLVFLGCLNPKDVALFGLMGKPQKTCLFDHLSLYGCCPFYRL